MAFRQKKSTIPAPATPVGLLPLLTRRSIPDAMSHQKEMLENYANDMVDNCDVAMQLPTGSGKTLVGLLIAEWRRRKFQDRVVYLCPTRQLVHQTAEQAHKSYGIDAVAFTGPKQEYLPDDISSYTTGAQVAITTYSSLFNSHPFFHNPDIIVLDDAHAAENYVAKMWSLEIPTGDESLSSLHSALVGEFKRYISHQSYVRLTGDIKSPLDLTWVDKLPNKAVAELTQKLTGIFDTHGKASDGMRFTWPLLREHLHACNIFLSAQGILIRPLIPPTWSHEPFENSKQRIYMSATLGKGGDLERLTGRKKVFRIPAPEEFQTSGVGRRFFIFPGLSLRQTACEKLRKNMQIFSGRSVVLTTNSDSAEAISEQFKNEAEFKIFTSDNIETSKTEFINTEKAAAIMAGRFDGIDFPHDECRLLCLDGMPKATNAQERFLMSKLGAGVLLNERMQTRVLQAVGRCTRALQDRSAVFVTGDELLGYLSDDRNWRHFPPELQAELSFGVFQSKDGGEEELMANFRSFIANDADWDEANRQIHDDAENHTQLPYPVMEDLESVVSHEVGYQKAIWSDDYEQALSEARTIIAKLNADELRGYRALWHYLAGSASQMLSTNPSDSAAMVAREQYTAAKRAAPNVSWLAPLARGEDAIEDGEDEGLSEDVNVQVERLESALSSLGTTTDHKFEKRVKDILESLATPDAFEEGQRQLGELLGFVAGNDNSDAAPDPWWLGATKGIVFEDHAGGQVTTVLGADKARQAALHLDWLEENVPEAKGMDIDVVLVTPCTSATVGAKPALRKVRYWNLDEFRAWAKGAVEVLRELKSSLPPNSDLFWRGTTARLLLSRGLTLETIINTLPVASDGMKFNFRAC